MRRYGQLLASFVVVLIAFSCATEARMPSWALTTPPPDSTYTYFVGNGSGNGVDAALDDASASLVATIMQYVGSSVTVESEAVARATLDTYSSTLKQTVRTESENRLSGFQIKERSISTDGRTGSTTAHILAAYTTSELTKEKERIRKLIQDEIDAIGKPEAKGDSLLDEERAVEAIPRYLDAMVAASVSKLKNADIWLEQIAGKTRSVLSSIRFSVSPGQTFQTTSGKTPQPLPVRITADRPGFTAGAVVSAPLLVTYPKKLPAGRMGSDTLRSVTDAMGLLNLTLPVPDFTGKGKIVIQLDLESSYEILDRLGPRYGSLRNAIEDDIRAKILEIPYVVTSNARTVPMAIFAVELDVQGKVVGSDTFQSALLDSLTREGYSLRALPLDPALGAGMIDDRILVAAKQVAGDSFGRLAYGVARIESVRKDGAFYIVSASARIKVAEISGGKILYSADKSWQAVANDEATAIRAAYRELGSRLFGPDLAATLP